MASQTVTEKAPRTLREAIARSQLTNEQIIAKVGCTKKSLVNWKNGVRPRDYYIGRLSAILGLDLWPLYEGTKDNDNGKGSSSELTMPSIPIKSNFAVEPMMSFPILSLATHQHIDEGMKQYVREQISRLWEQFHTAVEATSTETLLVAAHTCNQLLATFTQWPLADNERKWLSQALVDGAILSGRIARDQINYQRAIARHKYALTLALDASSSDHVAAATMRLAETLWEAGLIFEAVSYCRAGIEHARGANARVRGELLGFAAEIYSFVGDFHESERLANEAATLAVGAVLLPTAGGINFSETAAAEYLANEALRRGEAKTALAHITRARRLLTMEFPTSHNVRWEAHLLLDQARAHSATGELESASDDLQQAIRLAQQIASHIAMRKAQDLWQELALQQKKPIAIMQLGDELLELLTHRK
jgi:tetratricopeptide (TPR) repeat protein